MSEGERQPRTFFVHRWKWKVFVTSTTLVVTQVLS